jgi:hypothetical protein
VPVSPLARLWAAWDRWWFVPVDARVLAAMRISLGVMLTVSWVLLWPELELLYGDEGLVDHRVVTRSWTDWRISHLDNLSGPGLHAAHALGLVALLSFTAGFGTRVANVLVAAALVGLYHRDPWIQNGGDRLLRMWALYMCLTPSGAVWSVDAWIRDRRGAPAVTTVPMFGLRLVQLQVCWMYLDTGVEKLTGSGWTDGSAISWALGDGTFNRAPWLIDPLLYTTVGQAAAYVVTLLTLVWELLFVPLVLWRRTRAVGLVVGIVLHLGIFLTMSVGMFGPASVWGYQAFWWDRWPWRGRASAGGRGAG